jgi:WD40 repeat protein
MPGFARRRPFVTGGILLVLLLLGAAGYIVWSLGLVGPEGWKLRSVVMTPAGLCITQRDEGVWIEDAATGKFVRKLPDHRRLLAVDLGGRLATSWHDQKLAVWEIASGRELLSVAPAHSLAAVSPDGAWVVAWILGKGTLEVFDVKAGTLIHSRPHPEEGSVWYRHVAVHAGARRVAFVVDEDRKGFAVMMRDVDGGIDTEIRREHSLRKNFHMAFDPAGQRLVLAIDRTVAFYDHAGKWLGEVDASSPERADPVEPRTDFVDAFALDADGSRLAMASYRGDVRVVDVKTLRELTEFPSEETAHGTPALAFSADGNRLFVASRPYMDGWRLRFRTLEPVPRAAAAPR